MYIAVKYYYTRDFLQTKKITLKYQKMQEIIANSLNKLLGSIAYKEFVKCLDFRIKTETD